MLWLRLFSSTIAPQTRRMSSSFEATVSRFSISSVRVRTARGVRATRPSVPRQHGAMRIETEAIECILFAKRGSSRHFPTEYPKFAYSKPANFVSVPVQSAIARSRAGPGTSGRPGWGQSGQLTPGDTQNQPIGDV